MKGNLMIWFRRIVAVFLAFWVVLFFVVALLLNRVNDTAGNPQFYDAQLREADAYNFVYDKALPAALSENANDLPDDMGQFQPQIVNLAKQTLTPQWLQTQVEATISQVLPYVLGDTQSFKVNIPLKDRVQAGIAAAKSTLQSPDVWPKLYNDIVNQIVDQALANTGTIPSGLALSRSDLDSLIRTAMPQDWLQTQAETAIDQVAPYLTGDNNHFTIQVNIADRMPALQTAVTAIFKRQQTYDYIYSSVLAPAIAKNIQITTQLPVPGLTLSEAEVLQTIRQAFPLDWYQARVADIIAQTFAYLEGKTQTLNAAIPLADRKPAITQALVALAQQKLQAMGISPDQLKQVYGVDLNTLLQPLVAGWVPGQITFTQADLETGLGNLGGGSNFIDQARGWVLNGITYTDQDLRNHMGADFSNVEDARTRIATGVSFTQVDLRNSIKDDSASGAQSLRDFDNARSALGTLRHWRLVFWIVPVLLLVGIGFLGGRRWSTRLIWGAAPLAVAGMVALVAFGPVFGSAARAAVDTALSQSAQGQTGLQLVLTQKATEIAHNSINSFVGGLVVQSIIMLVIGLLLVVGGVVWYVWFDRRRRKEKGTAAAL